MQTVHIFVGLPASGKTTFYNKHKEDLFVDTIRLSLDDFRWQCTTTHFSPGFEPFVKMWIDVTGEYLLDHGHSLIIDATNIYANLRSKWIQLACKYSAQVAIYFFTANEAKCLLRNKGREGEVPESVISFMASKFEPVLNEGQDFDFVVNMSGGYRMLQQP